MGAKDDSADDVLAALEAVTYSDSEVGLGAVADPDSTEPPESKPARTRKPRSDKGQSRTGTTRGRVSNARLVEDLCVPWLGVASVIALPAPTVGAVMTARAEVTMKALVAVAADHPKALAALKKIGKVGPASELATTALMMALAIGIETNRIAPDHVAAQMSGVSGIFYQMQDEMAKQAQSQQYANSHVAPVYPFGPPPVGNVG